MDNATTNIKCSDVQTLNKTKFNIQCENNKKEQQDGKEKDKMFCEYSELL